MGAIDFSNVLVKAKGEVIQHIQQDMDIKTAELNENVKVKGNQLIIDGDQGELKDYSLSTGRKGLRVSVKRKSQLIKKPFKIHGKTYVRTSQKDIKRVRFTTDIVEHVQDNIKTTRQVIIESVMPELRKHILNNYIK